jgi:hypothetical protein
LIGTIVLVTSEKLEDIFNDVNVPPPVHLVENWISLITDFNELLFVYDILPLEADAGTVTVKDVVDAAVTVALTDPKNITLFEAVA